MNRGFTLFVAMVIMGSLLLISSGIVGLAVKQARIAAASRDSQHAFYAADTAMECAIYWDVNHPEGISAFDPSRSTTITCNGQSFIVGGSSESWIDDPSITFAPDPYCAKVRVTKTGVSPVITEIEAFGYNTCDAANLRRVERAVQATY